MSEEEFEWEEAYDEEDVEETKQENLTDEERAAPERRSGEDEYDWDDEIDVNTAQQVEGGASVGFSFFASNAAAQSSELSMNADEWNELDPDIKDGLIEAGILSREGKELSREGNSEGREDKATRKRKRRSAEETNRAKAVHKAHLCW